MKASKKKKKGNRLAKLRNGGVTGDPKNTEELLAMLNAFGSPKTKPFGGTTSVSQSASGFPLYKEDGDLTPTPTSPFYTQTDQTGYYKSDNAQGDVSEEGELNILPLMLDEAETFSSNDSKSFDLSSIDSFVQQTGGGVFSDYANIPTDAREKYEAQVTQGINDGAPLAFVGMSPLLAVGAAPILAQGLSSWAAISSVPIVSMEGAGLVTVGQAVDLAGAGMAIEYAPQHVKDFIEKPSISGAAWLGLDLLGVMMGGSAAKNIYSQGLKASGNLKNPMTFTSSLNLVDDVAIGIKVDQAGVLFNRVVKDEISQISTNTKISAADKQNSIDEVYGFYENYLNNPKALEKLVAQKEMLDGVRHVPMSPVIVEDAVTQSFLYGKMTPYYSVFDDAGAKIGAYADPSRPIRSFTLTPTEVSPGVFEAIPSVNFFSNTPAGKQAAAEALLQNLKNGSESSKGAVLRTQEYFKQTYGYRTRGIAKPQLNISGQVDMIDGVVVPEGYSGFDLSAQQIEMLETLTPEQFVSTLLHETNHNMLTPFLDQMADLQIMEMHMIGATNRIPQFRNGKMVFDKTLAEGFHSGDDMVSSIQEVSAKYNSLYPELSTGELDRHIMELLLPDEGIARLWEIKKAYSAQVAKQGMNFEDWMYKFTPEKAEEAINAWKAVKGGSEDFYEADIFLDLFQGGNINQKLRSLASALNETFTPLPVIGVGAAAGAVGEQQYKKGGFIAKKFRPRGMNLRKSN